MKSFAASAALCLAMFWPSAARAEESLVLRIREVHSAAALVQNNENPPRITEVPKTQAVAAGDEVWSAETRIMPGQPFYVKLSTNGRTFELQGTLQPDASGTYSGDVAFSKTEPIAIQGGDNNLKPVAVSQGKSTVSLRKDRETPLMTTSVGEKSISFLLTLYKLAAEKNE